MAASSSSSEYSCSSSYSSIIASSSAVRLSALPRTSLSDAVIRPLWVSRDTTVARIQSPALRVESTLSIVSSTAGIPLRKGMSQGWPWRNSSSPLSAVSLLSIIFVTRPTGPLRPRESRSVIRTWTISLLTAAPFCPGGTKIVSESSSGVMKP